MSESSFSFDELQSANTVKLPDPETLTASDGVKLSYRRYAPMAPRAVVLFYHGGGAHSGAGYQYLGSGLQNEFDIAVYVPDIRGHGASEGPGGDTPNPRQVWKDITCAGYLLIRPAFVDFWREFRQTMDLFRPQKCI